MASLAGLHWHCMYTLLRLAIFMGVLETKLRTLPSFVASTLPTKASPQSPIYMLLREIYHALDTEIMLLTVFLEGLSREFTGTYMEMLRGDPG